MDYATFVAAFTEFANTDNYPQTMVEFWLAQAPSQLNADRLKAAYPLAVALFAAHNLALERIAMRTAALGGAPGSSTGVTSSKSVDGVSVSYDNNIGTSPNAGHWDLTTYGRRLWKLIKAAGGGPIYRAPTDTRDLSRSL